MQFFCWTGILSFDGFSCFPVIKPRWASWGGVPGVLVVGIVEHERLKHDRIFCGTVRDVHYFWLGCDNDIIYYGCARKSCVWALVCDVASMQLSSVTEGIPISMPPSLRDSGCSRTLVRKGHSSALNPSIEVFLQCLISWRHLGIFQHSLPCSRTCELTV